MIVPANADPEKWDVYQVKKFALNLDASQKNQIEASFRRVLVALVRRDVPLNDWYLVTPLDPDMLETYLYGPGEPQRLGVDPS